MRKWLFIATIVVLTGGLTANAFAQEANGSKTGSSPGVNLQVDSQSEVTDADAVIDENAEEPTLESHADADLAEKHGKKSTSKNKSGGNVESQD